MTKRLLHASAFVVQFRSAADPEAGRLSGRVEHVDSGRTAIFQSVEELPLLLRKMLRDVMADERNEIG